MAKSRSKQPVPPTLMTSKRLPRLDGDDLFAWAQIVTRTEHMMQAKQQMALAFLEARGYTPGPSGHLLTDDGYIVTQAEAQQATRVRTLSAGPTGAGKGAPPADLPELSPPPGNES